MAVSIDDNTNQLNNKLLREIRQQWYVLTVNRNGRSLKEISEYLYKSLKNGLCCAACGERHFATLDFHHSDPQTKDFAIAEAQNKNFERLLNEAEKCVVLCSNCHRRHHYDNK